MRPGINRVADNLVFVMPDFIHDFGDDAHHWSMARTCEFDEWGAPVRGTGPSDRRYIIHEFLDLNVFYPIKHFLKDTLLEGRLYDVIGVILGFFWGLNCGFPLRDVARYTVWSLRGCKPLAVFRKKGETWVKTYPEEKEARAPGGHQEATGRGLRIYATNKAGEGEIRRGLELLEISGYAFMLI